MHREHLITKHGIIDCDVKLHNYEYNFFGSFDFVAYVYINDKWNMYISAFGFSENDKDLYRRELLDRIIEAINLKNGICIDGKFYDFSTMSLEEYMNFCKRKYIQYDNKQ